MTVLSAGTSSWTCAFTAPQVRRQQPRSNAMSLGAHATMPFITTASRDGSTSNRLARLTIRTGSWKELEIEK